jgi:hypothetical protein
VASAGQEGGRSQHAHESHGRVDLDETTCSLWPSPSRASSSSWWALARNAGRCMQHATLPNTGTVAFGGLGQCKRWASAHRVSQAAHGLVDAATPPGLGSLWIGSPWIGSPPSDPREEALFPFADEPPEFWGNSARDAVFSAWSGPLWNPWAAQCMPPMPSGWTASNLMPPSTFSRTGSIQIESIKPLDGFWESPPC